MKAFIGLDAGSVSVKIAFLDADGKILESKYVRHKGDPLRVALELLKEAPSGRSLSITGSAGKLIANALGIKPVNEVIAGSYSTRKLCPDVRTIIEMGGEDSKLILLQDRAVKEFSMNSVCAAGTGSFLDQQAERLNLSIEEFGQMALKSENPPRIAGRCSVFAKSDMIHYCGDTNVHIFMGPDRGGYVCVFRNAFHIGSRPAKTLLSEIEAGRNLSSSSVMDNARLDFVQRLIRATRAKPREFQLHFLPWLKKFNERIFGGGLMLVAGDAAGMPEPFMAGGVWQAMYSSRLAARIAVRAHSDKDFSKAYFKQYMEDLKASPVGVDFTAGTVLRHFFSEWTSQTFYDLFDNVADAMFYGMLTMAGTSRPRNVDGQIDPPQDFDDFAAGPEEEGFFQIVGLNQGKVDCRG